MLRALLQLSIKLQVIFSFGSLKTGRTDPALCQQTLRAVSTQHMPRDGMELVDIAVHLIKYCSWVQFCFSIFISC